MYPVCMCVRIWQFQFLSANDNVKHTKSNIRYDTGGASDMVKAKSSGEDPRATGGLVSHLPHPRVN